MKHLQRQSTVNCLPGMRGSYSMIICSSIVELKPGLLLTKS